MLSNPPTDRPSLRPHRHQPGRSARGFAALLFSLSATVAGTACSGSDTARSGSSSPTAAESKPSASTRVESASLSTDDTVEALQQISQYWQDEAGTIGIANYEPVPDARLQPLGGQKVDCDGEAVPDEDVEDNAVALSCEEGYTVLWDPAMLNDLAGKYGAASAIEVLAHEWGHIIDYQLGLDLQGVIAEQFADCMAGAWAADASVNKRPPYQSRQALDGTIASVAEFRDDPGDNADDDDAHGSGFDRVRAFQEGFDRGGSFCISYKDTPPALTEIPFADTAEQATSGNLSFEATIQSDTKNLGDFMTQNPAPFADVEIEFRSVSESDAAELHQQIGDAATSVILATDAAAEAQRAAGEEPDSEGSLLQQACWTGAYFGWIWGGNSADTELSPGDLDEAIAAFVALTDESAAGFVFEQVSQMRTGFVQGVSACTNPG